MSSARLRNFVGIISLLFTGTALSSGLAFVTQVVLARSLASVDFGRLSVLLVAINFFTPIGSGGVNWLLLRVFGQEGWEAERWIRSATLLVTTATILSVVGLVVYLLSAGLVVSNSALFLAGAIAILIGQIAVELGSSSFQLEDRYRTLAIWQSAPFVGRFAIVALAFALSSLTETYVVLGYGVLGLVLTAISFRSLASLATKARQLSRRTAAAIPRVKDILLEAGPYSLMTVFYVTYFSGGVVIVERLGGSAAAAEYNASSLVFAALGLIPNVIYMKFLTAKLCRWAEHDRKTFAAAFHVGVLGMAALGAVLAIMLAASASHLVPLLYGGKYADAAVLVAVRAVAIPFNFAQMAYSSLFISRIDVTRKVSYLGVTAVVSVLANLILVPAFGVIGAAIANVISEIVLLVLHILGTARHINGIDVWDTMRRKTFRASLKHLMSQGEGADRSGQAAAGGLRDIAP